MTFSIDEETLIIKGRKGDTASFTFNFKQDISAYSVHFYVKKNIVGNAVESPDNIIICKEYQKPAGGAITVDLTPEDTNKLASKPNSYNTYFWGLKIFNGNDYAQTLIPKEFENPPMMQIYPAIG